VGNTKADVVVGHKGDPTEPIAIFPVFWGIRLQGVSDDSVARTREAPPALRDAPSTPTPATSGRHAARTTARSSSAARRSESLANCGPTPSAGSDRPRP
jgi:hypothetical protein